MTAALATWLAEPLPSGVAQVIDRLRHAEDVQRIAVMPDVHLGGDVCVGMVLATSRLLYPGAVGGDIGCGMAALRFDAAAELLADRTVAAQLLDAFARYIPAGRHARAAAPALPPGLATQPLGTPHLEALRRREARAQLGTLGAGNHFLELQQDDEGWLWLMLHSGSRALGQGIRDAHAAGAAAAGAAWTLAADTPEGEAYLADLGWALAYAEANRRRMVEVAADAVERLFGIHREEATLVTCHHNYVRRELHDGVPYWVHRKGAISAQAGEPGLVPGSMGASSFHVEGRGDAASLCSSAHGAGRAMSRSEARRRISVRELEREMRGVWFDHRRADALRDEAPGAYKDIGRVMRAQAALTRIVRRLRPLLSYKGS